MSSDPPRNLMALLAEAKLAVHEEIVRELADAGHPGVRPGHGCVFGYLDADGARLTERARMTKQAVGEAATELERLGYLVREPDPTDGRAKILRLTERGLDA